MGKKLGYGIVGLVLIAAVYYFTSGSAQIVEHAKQQLNTELATLQQNGFAIKDRKSGKKEEHFIISFDDPQKITAYLNTQGAQMTLEDAKALKGMQIGVDATYLPDSASAIAMDLYPVALPKQMFEGLGEEDEKLIAHIEKMLERKALLLHISFDKMLSGFKGSIKDINETVTENGEQVAIAAKGMTFKGKVSKEQISQLSQKVDLVSLDAGKELQLRISGIEGGYSMTGKSPYDVTSRYRTDSLTITADSDSLALHITNLENKTQNVLHDNLLKSVIVTNVEKVEILQNQRKDLLEKIQLDLSVDNIDVATLEALQQTDPEDQDRINTLLQQFFTKGISVTIPQFSVGQITDNGVVMEGFDMNGSLVVDKSFDINAVSQNPLLGMDALHIETHISVSDALYAQIIRDPRAMIFMMMMPPVSKEGKKIYDIRYDKGKLIINGTPLL